MRALLFWGIALLPLVSAAQGLAVRSQDLKSMIETKNEKILAKVHEKSAAESREGVLARSFLPTIELRGAQESFRKGTRDTRTQPAYGAEARVNLFNGGRDALEDSKRSLTSERKGFEKNLTLTEELDKAREIYWRIVYLREARKVLKEALALNEENLKSAARRHRSGVATETDRVEFEMKAIDLKREAEQTDLEFQGQTKMMSVILGLEPDVAMSFPEELGHEHEWEASLKHDHGDHEFIVKPKELQSEELRLEAKSRGRSYWPRLDAYAGWNQFNERQEDFSDAKDRQESVVGLRLSVDLFDGWNSRREAAAAAAEAEAAGAEVRYLRREIEIHIHNEMAELKLLHAQVHEAEENIKRATRYYTLTQSEYSRGVKNSPDVLGATEKLFDMKLKHLAIVRDFQLAKSHVLSKIGK